MTSKCQKINDWVRFHPRAGGGALETGSSSESASFLPARRASIFASCRAQKFCKTRASILRILRPFLPPRQILASARSSSPRRPRPPGRIPRCAASPVFSGKFHEINRTLTNLPGNYLTNFVRVPSRQGTTDTRPHATCCLD